MASWAEVLGELEAEAAELEANLAADRAFAPPPEWVPPAMDTAPTEEDIERIKALLHRQEILLGTIQSRLADAPDLRTHHFVTSEQGPTVLDRSA